MGIPNYLLVLWLRTQDIDFEGEEAVLTKPVESQYQKTQSQEPIETCHFCWRSLFAFRISI